MLTVAVVGCGRIGSLLEDDPLRPKPASHMGAIAACADRVRLLAVCDTDRQRLLLCQKRWHVPHVYLDYREMIGIERPDLLVIATWTESHRDIAVFAAGSGVRGIVLEKPVAIDLEQAREIVATCRARQVKLVINHERRWDPLYRKAAEIVREGKLGALRTIVASVLCQSAARGSWKSVLDEVGGGPLLHDGTHLIDMIRYLGGEIHTVQGSVRREVPEVGVETTAVGQLECGDRVVVFLEAGGMREYFHFELDLQFERGRLKVGNGVRELWTVAPSTRYSGFADLVPGEFPPLPGGLNPFTGALREVADAIDQDLPESAILSSGIDGLRAMEAVFALYYSAFIGGKPVALPPRLSGHPLKKMFQTGML